MIKIIEKLRCKKTFKNIIIFIILNIYFPKNILCLFLIIIFIFVFKFYLPISNVGRRDLNPYKYYINDCKSHIRYNRTKIKNKNPYISICLPALNMEKYIEQTLLSIINQSFQDFEIIIINDNSNDNTINILNKLFLEDSRIKIINHTINKGVYYSRMEAILNSNGKFIILMDPDDMFLNENLFKELYEYNLKNNLDVIEFTVYHQIEGRRNIIYPKKHFENHYHNFSKKIINQPQLSKLLFKVPNKNYYSYSICRNVWNKMIRKEIFALVHEFIGLDYFNKFVITADDMVINLIIYHFAHNYSNINLPGYMYNLRRVSMSRGDGGIELKSIRSINYLLYFKILYRYIKTFNISRNILYHEMKNLRRFIFFIKDCNITSYYKEAEDFLNDILNDFNANMRFKLFTNELLFYLNEDKKNNWFELFSH